MRGLLPASTLTNLGITGNGRAFEYLLAKMYSSNLYEIKSISDKLYNELSHTIYSFINRIKSEHGKQLQNYMKNTKENLFQITKKYLDDIVIDSNPDLVKLIDYESNIESEIKVVSSIIYENSSGQSLTKIREYVKNNLSEVDRHNILDAYVKFRDNRRHRPGRAYEMVDYTFEFFTNFGMFRDLHRHRILTMERQQLSTKHGYDIPEEVIEAGILQDFKDCMYKSDEAYKLISKTMPNEAQYVVNFAYRYPYFVKINLREACHMIELRTLPQGHPDYRFACQEVYKNIKKVHPFLATGIKYVDENRYKLERLSSEKNIERKRRELKKN